ncbi:glycosyl hydrolase [Rhexocercosporidium sp. MPI-PUGE-AT-0058]|nr:glycosyl hydrolase [Rhexocercosporidium sp. MPI-PUGE-AT-0058]
MFNSTPMKLLVILETLVFWVSAASSVSTTFSNAIQYQFDTDGNAIDLTSGKVDWLGGAYVWYGLPFGCGKDFCGVATYSSTNLRTWHYNGLLFDPNTPEIEILCGATLSGSCGRPHIIYSAINNNYILWVDAQTPGYAIFTSNFPTGGFVRSQNRALVGYQPAGPFKAGDFSVHVINGTGYIAYALLDFSTTGASIWPPFLQSLYVQRLTPDMRNTTSTAYHVLTNSDLVDMQAESPDIFKRGDYFYITASNTCGFCTGTLLVVYRSENISGPWIRQIISSDTCGGQTTGVLTLPAPNSGATSYIHSADLFRTAPIVGTRTATHGHQFQKLEFKSDGSLKDLDCSLSKSVTVSLTSGTGVSDPMLGRAVSATDGSGEIESYAASCNLPYYQLYQTWKSSKSGKLTEVGVNIAGVAPTGNLTITIFRYDNDTNFFTPRYIWETLTTFNLVPSNTSQSLQVVRVPVGKAVKQGDRLGMALVSGSITPMCTLVKGGGKNSGSDVMGNVYDRTSDNGNGRTLFANGPGQVSLRGKNGKTPPIRTLDQEIKWYATVN